MAIGFAASETGGTATEALETEPGAGVGAGVVELLAVDGIPGAARCVVTALLA